ncbi:MAG TPA: protein kinase [Polyangiaceae bacterium]|jgi:serine/threonine-protein kinase
MALVLGKNFGRYTLEGILGTGGMGEVYVAFDPLLHRRVALKILQASDGAAGSGRDLGAAILREARAAAALEHPNAVAIYEVGEASGIPYIAMERVQGRSLRASIGDPSIAIGQRVRWLIEVARALAAAHERGLVHRDVKPENVMVRDDGAVKVLDFGIARPAHSRSGAAALLVDATASTVLAGGTGQASTDSAGTPLYMAPEQVRGEAIDGRTDQFAWAVTAYELLSGSIPWKTSDASSLVTDILGKVPPPLDLVNRAVPPAVAATVAKAMAKVPGERFASLQEVIAALEPVLAMQRSEAGSVGSAHPLAAATTRDPVAPAATASSRPRGFAWGWGILVAVLGLGSFAALRRNLAPPAPPKALAPQPTAVTDLPIPPTPNHDAADAFGRALQAARDGANALYGRDLEEAAKADPGLAAAHLRLAIDSLGWSNSDARESFQKAVQLRTSLTERDRGLLEAYEPFLASPSPDAAEMNRRLTKLTATYPLDAELASILSGALLFSGDFHGAEAASERALQLDPKFGLVQAGLADIHAYLGEFVPARQAFDACLANFPGASSCMAGRMALADQTGDCKASEDDARHTVLVNPSGWLGYGFLAQAQLANHRPVEAARETLKLKWARLPPAQAYRQVADESNIAVYTGDFAAAEAAQKRFVAAIEPMMDELAHEAAARRYAEILTEEGKPAEAGRTAEAFLKRRSAWTPEPFSDDLALARDPRVRLDAVAFRGGRLTAEELEAARRAWLEEWRTRLAGDYVGYLWIYGYAMPAETPDEARAALEALRSAPPVPPYAPYANVWESVGRVYVLAGQPEAALPYLDRAVANCRIYDNPFEHVRGAYWRGRAREELGRTGEACADYAAVVAQWGQARPKSVTATSARARMAALKCP